MAGAALSGISGLLQGFSSTFVTAKLRKDWQEQEAQLHEKAAQDADRRAATVRYIGQVSKLAEDGLIDVLPPDFSKTAETAYGPLGEGLTNVLQGVIQQNAPKRALLQQRIQAQQGFLAPPTANEIGMSLQDQGVTSLTSGAPGTGAALMGATDPTAMLEQRVRDKPFAAKLAFEGKVDTKDAGGGLTAAQLLAHEDRVASRAVTERGVANREAANERLGMQGKVEHRETPGGRVDVLVKIQNGKRIVQPLGPPAKGTTGDERKTMTAVNDGLIDAGRMSTLVANPQSQSYKDIEQLFIPYIGRKWEELVSRPLDGLNGTQIRFLNLAKRFTNTRLVIQGGKTLSPTEERLYKSVLPGDLSATMNVFLQSLKDANEDLTTQGSELENTLMQSGTAGNTPRVRVTPYNRKLYHGLVRGARQRQRQLRKIPLYEGEVLAKPLKPGDAAKARAAAASAAPAPAGGLDPDLEAAFMQ